MFENKRGRGRPPVDPSKKVTGRHLAFSPEHWAVLEKMAEDQKISISRLILKLAQIGALLSVVSCSGKSAYIPCVSSTDENLYVNKTAYYAKTHTIG
jgi:hypothetical protein